MKQKLSCIHFLRPFTLIPRNFSELILDCAIDPSLFSICTSQDIWKKKPKTKHKHHICKAKNKHSHVCNDGNILQNNRLTFLPSVLKLFLWR